MKVGAPENRIELALGFILTPRLKTSTAGTWIDRHRSCALYAKTVGSQASESVSRHDTLDRLEELLDETLTSLGISSPKIPFEEI